MPLKEQIAERKREEAKQQAAAPSCHRRTYSNHPATFIEFQPDPHTRTGFPTHQLCHYTLDANPAASGEADAPQRLTLAFHTADVVITGARLSELAERLREHELLSVNTLDARYAETLGDKPWVGSIAITKPGKSGGTPF
jgi:hypothetical protein